MLKENVDFVNSNLLLKSLRAFKRGDFSVRLPEDFGGLAGEIALTFNEVVSYNEYTRNEIKRLVKTVGTDGLVKERALLESIPSLWADKLKSIDELIENLTKPISEVVNTINSVIKGDLNQLIPLTINGKRRKGIFLQVAKTVNAMVENLSIFASEVTRVSQEVGVEGLLGGQAKIKGLSGTWEVLAGSVNMMANNLTEQVRNIAEITTSVANGDLSKEITVDAKGEIFDLKKTINKMVNQLNSFASEVTRVSKAVGTDGVLGDQANVPGVSGIWKDLTDSVNIMANNLTDQVRNIAEVTTAVANGDLTRKITVEASGEILKLRNTINTMVDQLSSFASEVTRVAREVGTEGKLGGQASVLGIAGTWKDLTDNVNMMANNLTTQVRNIASVTTAVANGDFSKKIVVEVKGEISELKDTMNTMVDQLSSFASEVTRVAREVGTEGKLGGQASVLGVAGTWKELTDNVNIMAENLTNQVRGIAKVVFAVAKGELKKKLTLYAKGEIAELAETINDMTDTLALFADQVTNVAREVGIEGKLGAQAKVPGASGIWKDLTDNVNELAANLTTQVRAINDVATAVSKGDLSRTITTEAMGEVASLKNNINDMIVTLKQTTQINTEQDWLKSNLARFAGFLQGQRDLLQVGNRILSELSPLINAQHAAFYIVEKEKDDYCLKLLASYAFKERKRLSNKFKLGESLIGQCALEKKRILITEVPNDYVKIESGLGEASPLNIVVLPILFEGEIMAIIELASFNQFSKISISLLDQLTESIGIMLNTISATARTEELLKESQSMAEELQQQQEELRLTNDNLEGKAKQLELQNIEIAKKSKEVEESKRTVDIKANELALTSKYKSEFLANMSHELRTPLNSQLMLSKLLSENKSGNLDKKQIEYAETIHACGIELLDLINEVLDLSKIESGKMTFDIKDVPFVDLKKWSDKNFRPLAKEKNLGFAVQLSKDLPDKIKTDENRLKQLLKNLLSNAFKFTNKGKVEFKIAVAYEGWSPDNKALNVAETVISFAVTDTGIGIPKDKQKIIFEAFQQTDGTTSRKFGGTGLGLSICREIIRLFNGEIKVDSQVSKGSTFTFYLPQDLSLPPSKKSNEGNNDEEFPDDYLESDEETSDIPDSSNINYANLGSGETTAQYVNVVEDDRDKIKKGDRVLLIVEDDADFARLLLDHTHIKGIKGIISMTGTDVSSLVEKYKPDFITLDLRLSWGSGYSILYKLKHDPLSSHIPVHIISIYEPNTKSFRMGAIGHLQKPVTPEDLDLVFKKFDTFVDSDLKRLLIVEDDQTQLKSMTELLSNNDIRIKGARTAKSAIKILKSDSFDCIVLDLRLPDMNGFDLIEHIRKTLVNKNIPIIVYTGKDITREEETRLKKVSERIILKDVRSLERLVVETTLFLHRNTERIPVKNREMIKKVYQKDYQLNNKKVLIVDDDMRTIFAITSLLEQNKMKVLFAENGLEGIEQLNKNPDIDIVLMDIMMPEMNGYEAISQIRNDKKYKSLPIIALTAKALKEDRDKCLEIGASDYVSKPVDNDQILSLIRVWA